MIVLDYPLLLLLPLSFAVMAASAWLGGWYAARKPTDAVDTRDDFNIILAATLTLLGLIIGFTFSMALTRYDQRKNLEEEEANAIGTEYLRADFLPAAAAAKTRSLLRDYANERIRFYGTRDEATLREIGERTAKLQAELWAAIRDPAMSQRDPVSALVVSGMNDVLNSQGYTQAAWWNRIPLAAWILMIAMAICANFMVGRNAKNPKVERKLLLVLPFVVAIAFFLIADIDAPHAGVIRIVPQNLNALVPSLR